MNFSHILLYFVCTLVFADSYINLNQSEFGPLDVSDSLQIIVLDKIRVITDSIIQLQKKLESVNSYIPSMQPFLTTNTVFEHNGRKHLEPLKFRHYVHKFANMYLAESYNNVSFNSNTTRFISCNKFNLFNQTNIEIANLTRLMHILKFNSEVKNHTMAGVCSLVFFRSKLCPFSTFAEPHFKLLQKIFPQIKMVTVNALSEHMLLTVFDIVGLPTLILFHNGIPFLQFINPTFSLYELTKFVIRYTDLTLNEIYSLSEADLFDFVPEDRITKSPNYTVWLAWFVIIFWIQYYARDTDFWMKIVEEIKIILREAAEDCEHND